jgi:tetratricopeptide (TPR) repeat protein
MKNLITMFLLLLIGYGPADSAGGSEKKSAVPDRLAEADRLYNIGLKHRDKAWAYEEQAAGATEKDQGVYLKSADREFERAIEAFKGATIQNSRHFEAFGSLGYALRKTGQFEDALKSYDRALKMSPDYPEALEYRAEAYLGLGRIEDAKTDYERLVKLDETLARTFLEAATYWIETADATGAAGVGFAEWVEGEKARLGPGVGKGW